MESAKTWKQYALNIVPLSTEFKNPLQGVKIQCLTVVTKIYNLRTLGGS